MISKLYCCPSHYELKPGQPPILNDKVRLISYELSEELFELVKFCHLPRTEMELIDRLSKNKISTQLSEELILDLDLLIGNETENILSPLRRVKSGSLRGIDLRINSNQLPWIRGSKLFSVKAMIGFSLLALLSLVSIGLVANKSMIGTHLPLWGLVLVLISTPIHELGHAFAFKSLGGSAFSIGAGFYFFIPVLFVDVSLSNSLSKTSRLKINLAGIYFELLWILLLSCFSMFIDVDWLATVILLIGIQVLWNLNPFFKTDGYWVLSDLWDVQWLMQRSTVELKLFLKAKGQLTKLVLYSLFKALFVIYFLFHFIYRLFLGENPIFHMFIDFLKAPSLSKLTGSIVVPILLIIYLMRYAARRLQ